MILKVTNPQGTLQDVPWASLVSDINTNGENLAPGYVLDLPNSGGIGRTFNVQTYPAEVGIPQVAVFKGGLEEIGLIPDSIAKVAANEDAFYNIVNSSKVGTTKVNVFPTTMVASAVRLDLYPNSRINYYDQQ